MGRLDVSGRPAEPVALLEQETRDPGLRSSRWRDDAWMDDELAEPNIVRGLD